MSKTKITRKKTGAKAEPETKAAEVKWEGPPLRTEELADFLAQEAAAAEPPTPKKNDPDLAELGIESGGWETPLALKTPVNVLLSAFEAGAEDPIAAILDDVNDQLAILSMLAGSEGAAEPTKAMQERVYLRLSNRVGAATELHQRMRGTLLVGGAK